MRFTKPFWAGIADGSITLAFRAWARPTVVVGRPYRTGGGRVEVVAVDTVSPDDITDDEARRAGHRDGAEIRARLAEAPRDRAVYRVEFRLLDEADPRELLANDAELGADDLAEIDRRLERLDRAAATPWTHRTLRLVADHPAVRAPDLAAAEGRETQPFKLDVRKLKNLGLTVSLRVGYRLSPRGEAYLAARSGDRSAESDHG